MAITNDTTPNLGLQLPHPSNSLEDDVLRLRSAINALDSLLASDDPSLNTVQTIVDGLKTNIEDLVEHVGVGGGVHAAATGSVAGFMSAADKTKLDGVTLGALIDPVVVAASTVGQTSFAVPGGYTVGAIDVLLDGVELLPEDYEATDGADVVLAVGVELATSKMKIKRYRACLRA
jgi:hypothetical protein